MQMRRLQELLVGCLTDAADHVARVDRIIRSDRDCPSGFCKRFDALAMVDDDSDAHHFVRIHVFHDAVADRGNLRTEIAAMSTPDALSSRPWSR
jgi:hypothetical protein